MDESVAQKDEKLVAGKLLELVYRRFSLTFWSTLLVSGGVVAALWAKVKPEILLAWMLSLWLVAAARQFYARRYLATGRDNVAGQGKWLAGMVLGAVAGGACWGSPVYLFPANPGDVITMLLLFVIAGVAGFACVTMAAVPVAAMAFMFFALVQPAFWLFSFGGREYYFMGGVALVYLALMMVYVRQMHRVIRNSLTTSEQNKELAAALRQVKALEYAAAQKENEQRYRELFANFEDNIVFVDVGADGKFSVASLNPAAERTFGLRDADVRGKSKFDLFPADLAARLVEYDLACVGSGRPLSYEDALELPSGKRYFSVTQIPMFDESGKVCRIAAISRDITERKQMEETLATREREFRVLVESAPDPIFRYDSECRRVYVNQAVTRLSGIPQSQLLGQTPTGAALVPSAESMKVLQSVRRVLDTGVTDEIEVLFVAPDGSEMYFQNIHVPEFAADGSVQGVLSMGRDVTARKYMAEVLQKSEREYRTLAENAPDNIIRYDRECRARYLNKNAEATLGMPAGYMIGKRAVEVFSDGLFDELELAIKGVIVSGHGRDYYQTLPDTGQGERYHHLRINPERDEHGVVSGALVIGRDITERKQMEEQLVAREQQFRALAENTPDPIYRYDRDCRRIYVNPAVTRITGKPAEELLGSKPADGAILVSEQHQSLMDKIRRVFDCGEVESLDLDYTLRGGARRDYQMMLVPERDDSGAVVTVLGIARDVTEIRDAERRLSQFVANVPGYAYTYKLHADGHGSFLFASPGIKDLYGVTPEEVADNADALRDLIHPDDAARMAKLIEESARSLTPYALEHRIIHPVKGERWLESRAAPQPASDGIQWHGMALDITERKRMEEELQLKERALDQAHDAVYLIDDQARFAYVNDAACRALDYSREELLGMSVTDIDRAYTVEDSNAVGERTREDGSFAFETQHRRRDGSLFPVEIQASALVFQGKHLGLALARDISERKRGEAALAESNTLLRNVLQGIPDPVWMKDAEGAFVVCNEGVARLFNMKVDEIIGKDDYDFFPPEQAEFYQNKDRAALEAGRVLVNEEWWTFGDNGEQALMETRKTPVRSPDGKLLGVLGVARDITARKSIEKAFRDSESMLQEAQRIAHVGSWDVDMVNDKLTWSDEIFRIWEIDKTKFRADFAAFLDTVHPDDRERVNRIYNEAVVNHTLYEVEHRLLFPDGRVKHILERGEPQYDEQGKPVRFIGTSLDITERKHMEETMAERERDFRSLAGNIPDNIARWDTEGRYLYVNPTHERLLGVKQEDLIGKSIPDDHVQVKAGVKQVVASGQAIHAVRQAVMINGVEELHDVSMVPEFDETGKLVSVLGMGRDMTHIYRMQEAVANERATLRTFFGALPSLAWMKDTEGRYLACNPQFEQLYGATEAEVLGKTDFDFVDAELAAFFRRKDKEAEAAGKPCVNEEWVTFAGDGRRALMETVKSPMTDASGKVVGVIGVAYDITERRQADEAVRRSEQLLRSVIDATPDWIFIKDREHRYQMVNKGYADALHLAPEDFIGKNDLDLGFPEELVKGNPEKGIRGFWADDRLVLDSNERQIYPDDPATIDGEVHTFHTIKTPLRNADGKPWGVLAFARDISERKLAERQLKETLEFSEGVINAIPDLLFEVNREGRYLNIWAQNPALLAAQRELLLGNTISEMLAPEAAAVTMSAIREAEENGLSLGRTISLVLPHGKSWFELSVSRKPGSGSADMHFLVLSRDITERKLAEEAVRESGAKLRSLYELSPLGIALTDMQGRYIEFNESFRAICGYPADELMTLDYWKLTPRRYEMQEIAQLESLAKTGRYGPYEKEYMQKDGTPVPIQLVGTLITGKDGTQHIWSIVEDIRGRKRTEAELKERLDRIVELNEHLERTARDLEDQTVELEAQAVELEASQDQLKQTEVWYRSILHSAPDGMLVVDERGCIMLVNERLETMFGYERGELQGLAVEVLIPYAVRERHVGLRDGFIARDGAYRQAAKTLFGCRKDGTEFPVDVSLSRLPEVEGMRSAICASVRDISERHAMEAAREAALAEMRHLAQLRSTFMAQMSHELRTPLNGILGYAQNLLQGEALGEKQFAGLQIIQNSGEHLLTLINGILDHAAIEADKFELIPGDIELEPFLSTIIGMIRVRAEQKNLAFVCAADAGLPAVVRGDAQRLRQILLNLLSNAVKFTDLGQVTLRVTCPVPSRLHFAVQDSGVGIAAEQLETIFIPFEQGGEVSRRAGGTGLGLSISRKLVKLMGGDIRVESQPGAGCTFSFEIDMAAVQSGAEKVNAAALSEQAVTRVVQASPQLLAPPKAELDVLYGSALRGNMREVIKHADRLAAQDSRYLPFAEQLRQLAKGFQTKALLGLIGQYRGETGGGR